jgi:hypothetical protein
MNYLPDVENFPHRAEDFLSLRVDDSLGVALLLVGTAHTNPTLWLERNAS